MASRALSTATVEEYSFAMAASFLNGSPATRRDAASRQPTRAMWARVSISAILNWIAWFAPIGLPNAWRSCAYFTDSSTQPCARPVARAEIAIRPSSRMRRNWA